MLPIHALRVPKQCTTVCRRMIWDFGKSLKLDLERDHAIKQGCLAIEMARPEATSFDFFYPVFKQPKPQ